MTETLGGVPVADESATGGSLVTEPGQLQYGRVLFGAGSKAGWRELVGWRDMPDAQVSDNQRPQAHGTYAGDVFGDALTVTLTYLVTGTPENKRLAIDALEAHTPMDGVERMLVVDDGTGPWFRMARVIGRQVPQGKHYNHAPVECSVQFLCADPRRYALVQRSGTVTMPQAVGGLDYPLTYPLSYGEPATAALHAANDGGAPTPLVVTFHGPLETPTLATAGWRLGFDITLVAGETLVVDTAEGTALLNGTADRLYTIQPAADPIEKCLLPPGGATLTLTAVDGTGTVSVAHRDARL